MLAIKKILHPTDFSPSAQYALELACTMARDHGACLIVLHVMPAQAPITGAEDVSVLRQAEACRQDLRGYQNEAQDRLQRLPLPGVAVKVERRLEEGETGTMILRTAWDTSCDLIVMGSHGRTGEARRLLGSVAEEVTQRAPCPVVTVTVPVVKPEPSEEPAREEVGVIL